MFLAGQLRSGTGRPEPTEADLRSYWLPLDTLGGLVRAGEMPHACSSTYAVLTTLDGDLAAGGLSAAPVPYNLAGELEASGDNGELRAAGG